MKKLLFFLLLSVFAFGQTKKTTKPKLTEKQLIENKAKEYFEKEFVQKTFKDPYSYELKKIWTEEITQYAIKYDSATSYHLTYLKLQHLKEKRGLVGLTIDETAEYKKAKDRATILDAETTTMSESEKSKIVGYKIFFDTYGANSYGNKILGRYQVKYWKNGELLGDVEERKN